MTQLLYNFPTSHLYIIKLIETFATGKSNMEKFCYPWTTRMLSESSKTEKMTFRPIRELTSAKDLHLYMEILSWEIVVISVKEWVSCGMLQGCNWVLL